MPPASSIVFGIFAALAALLVIGLIGRALLDNPREDVEAGIVVGLMRLYARWFHRLRVSGSEHIPSSREPGPLIIVSNHTSGIDPLVIQAACPFEVRWMMALDQQLPIFEAFWRWAGVITVDRDQGDPRSARAALDHLEDAGVVGIFAEGGLERPVRQILPFMPGVGLMIRKTRSPVLCAIVEDAPEIDPAWASLTQPSKTRLRFMPVIDYSDSKLSAREIAEDLRARYLEWTGWPANNDPDPGVSPPGAPRAQNA